MSRLMVEVKMLMIVSGDSNVLRSVALRDAASLNSALIWLLFVGCIFRAYRA